MTIRPMSTVHIDLLESHRDNPNSGDLIATRVIPECLGIPFTEYEKFLEGDEAATLIALRRASWGDKYTFKVICEHCKASMEVTQDLNEIEIKTVEDPDSITPFYLDYDDDGKINHVIKWRTPTVADRIQSEKEMRAYMAEKKSKQAFRVTYAVARHIADIGIPELDADGDPTLDQNGNPVYSSIIEQHPPGLRRRQAIRQFVSKHGADWSFNFLREISQHSAGVVTEFQYHCDNFECDRDFSATMEVNEGFFLPSRASSKSSGATSKRGILRKGKKNLLKQAATPAEQETGESPEEQDLSLEMESAPTPPSIPLSPPASETSSTGSGPSPDPQPSSSSSPSSNFVPLSVPRMPSP